MDDEDEVSRLVEIRSSQGFQAFHEIIIQSLVISVPCTGNFFSSDNDWHHEKKIGQFSGGEPEKNPKISNHVFDPHQRFLYEFEAGKIHLSFLVELVKILPDNPHADLPACVGGEGEIPKYYFKLPEPKPNRSEDLSSGERSLMQNLEAMVMGEIEGEGEEEELEPDAEDIEASDDESEVEETGEGDEDIDFGEDEDKDNYKSDLGFGEDLDDIDLSGFSEEEFN